VVLLADTGNSNLAHLSFQRHWNGCGLPRQDGS
jgi:hypothetical protein